MSAKKAGLSSMGSDFAPALVKSVASVAPPAAVKPATTAPSAQIKPISTVFRMLPMDWQRLKTISTAERISLQELLENGLNAMMAERGLSPLQGIPRLKRNKSTP